MAFDGCEKIVAFWIDWFEEFVVDACVEIAVVEVVVVGLLVAFVGLVCGKMESFVVGGFLAFVAFLVADLRLTGILRWSAAERNCSGRLF